MAELAILNPVVLNGVLMEAPNPPGLLGVTIVPRETFPFPTVAYDVVTASRSVAKATVPGAEAKTVKMLPIGQVNYRMLYTREKKVLDPVTLYWLRQVGTINDATRNAETHIRRELTDLNERNEKFVEWCIWQMFSGSLSIAEPDVNVSVDFRIRSSHKPTSTTLWSDTVNSNPIADVTGWKQLTARDAFVPLQTAYLNSKTMSWIFQNQAVQKLMSMGQRDVYLGTGRLPAFLGIDWVEYDGSYVDDAGNTQMFIPDGKVVFLNPANQAFKVLEGPSADAQAMGKPGKFTKSWEEEDPSARQLLVEYTFGPALIRPDQIVFATVG